MKVLIAEDNGRRMLVWQELASYVASRVTVSHGVCPACRDAMRPRIDELRRRTDTRP